MAMKIYEEKLKILGPHALDIMMIITICGTYWNTYISTISPYKILEETKKKRWLYVTEKAQSLIDTYKEMSIEIGFNIMVPKRVLFAKIEPKQFTNTKEEPEQYEDRRRLSIFPKVLTVVWSSGTHVNTKLKFTTKQGSCGLCFSNECSYSWDFEKMKAEKKSIAKEFNLSADQMNLTKKLSLLASFPIIYTEDTVDGQIVKILGVVNAESSTENAYSTLTDTFIKDSLLKSLELIATSYSSLEKY